MQQGILIPGKGQHARQQGLVRGSEEKDQAIQGYKMCRLWSQVFKQETAYVTQRESTSN